MAEGTVEGKAILNKDWDKLMKKVDVDLKESEVAFFIHCTSIKGKRLIIGSGKLRGRETDMPKRAPLASNDDVTGIWFTPSGEKLPKRSPYGTQRIRFGVDNMLSYLCSNGDEERKGEYPAEASETPNVTLEQENDAGCQGRREEGGINDESNSKKVWTKVFFECAYYYGSTQYVRLIMIRGSDPNAEWCRCYCKDISFTDNPFLLYKKGKIFTYSSCHRRGIHVQVFVVGDIELENLKDPPRWDKVGTLQKASHDPVPGVC